MEARDCLFFYTFKIENSRDIQENKKKMRESISKKANADTRNRQIDR